MASAERHAADAQKQARRGCRRKTARIAAGGSFAFFCRDLFSADEMRRAGDDGYVIVRDATCRLFGYHGARAGDAFSFDHMFGF